MSASCTPRIERFLIQRSPTVPRTDSISFRGIVGDAVLEDELHLIDVRDLLRRISVDEHEIFTAPQQFIGVLALDNGALYFAVTQSGTKAESVHRVQDRVDQVMRQTSSPTAASPWIRILPTSLLWR